MSLGKKKIQHQAAGADVPVNTENFNAVLYTGNGTTQSITGVGFQPDLVWVKSRSATNSHVLVDVVRGVKKALFSDLTNAELASSGNNFVYAFGSDGFSVGGADYAVNNSGQNFIGWCWKGGGTAVSNTDGSITSSVSANQDAGFSVVSYTGGGTSNYTVGHGLSSAPEMIIVKNRDQADNWLVWTTVIDGTSDYLFLNTAGAKGNSGQSLPTSTVVEVQADGGGESNTLNEDYIMYCFHSVSGYQKIGSYTGTGVAGNAQTLGFAPRFVLVKRTTASEGWWMFDTQRTDKRLEANSSNAESTDVRLNLTSTGFDFDGNVFNESGNTYIYLAIA